jgi:hypothetical protein
VNDTEIPSDLHQKVIRDTEVDELFREAQRRAHAERNATRCAVIRAATLEPLWRTSTAHFRVDPPIDTDFGDEDSYTFRIVEVRASVTHFTGDDHEEPHLEVECHGRRLTAKGELHRENARWIHLPTELAAELLGRAMVA